MSENTNVLEELHQNLEELMNKAKELESNKKELLRENRSASAALKGMNKVVAGKEGAKQTIRDIEKKSEAVAIESKQKLKEVVRELKTTYIQIKAIEQGIIDAQEQLEYIDDKEDY